MNFTKFGAIALFMLLFVACSGMENDDQVELTVSAAASLEGALTEIKAAFEREHEQIHINFNYGASGALKQQIRQGAPVDLYISAAAVQMDELAADGWIDGDRRTTLLTNRLVVVVPADRNLSQDEWSELTDLVHKELRYIAIGAPENVPAGAYAKEALEKAGIWDSLQDRLVRTKDVRQALHNVETGNSDAGIVYLTDALASRKVKIALTVDPELHDSIEYPVGIVTATNHPVEAEIFYRYLQSKEASDLFKQYGFGEL